MRNVGRAVEGLVDAVADVGTDDAAAAALSVRLDHVAKVAEQSAGLDQLDSLRQALAGRLGDAHRVRVGLRLVADVVCLVEIAVVAFMVEGDVEVEDVAVDEDALVGNAVADDLVERCADGLGEEVVVQGRRVRVALDAGVVYDLIEVVGGDAGTDGGSGNVENLTSEAADLAHALTTLLV